jgi:hypothetical protein
LYTLGHSSIWVWLIARPCMVIGHFEEPIIKRLQTTFISLS